ncbi:MAG: gamma-glutamylcyclotransferase family protein [Reyranellaceae bacterium]
MRFFFFGTLMDEAVLDLVVGRHVPATAKRPAVLHGYRRARVRGATYPIVVPAAGAEVAGVLASGLRPPEADRLTAYEGDGYVLAELEVSAGGGARRAHVYLPRSGGGLEALEENWDFDDWRRRHRAGFLARLRRSLSAVDADR